MIREQDVALVRSFNRLVTRQVGALSDRYLGRRPLGEARVLFEIGTDGATPRDVRARLGLDSGYVSRMIRSLERDGLVERRPDPADGRTKRLRLTRAGRAEMRDLDRISDRLAAGALAPLSDEQRARLLRAQAEVQHLLAISMITVGPEDPSSPDARWCLGHYFADLRERFEEEFDPGRTLPADSDDLVAPRGAFLLARLSGQPAGCGALKTFAPEIGEIMRMWVDRPHRGLGLGTRILAALERQATALGHRRVRLYTNRSLTEAQAMYRGNGYVEIARYNDDPYANHWFEKRLGALGVRRADGFHRAGVLVDGGLSAAAQHPRQVRHRDQHLARLRALVAGDDAAALEHVDQAARARVADTQATLDHRDGSGAGLDDDLGRLLEQVVLVRVEVIVARGRRRPRPRAPRAAPRRTRARPASAQWSVIAAISSSVMKAPWMRWSFEVPAARKSMSPWPSRVSAPPWSRITRESTWEETAKAIREGMLTLIVPVMMSVEGRWVASSRWMPTARAFWASRMIASSTSVGATIIRSASSSITQRMYGSGGSPSLARGSC